jgi:hypothetical protein
MQICKIKPNLAVKEGEQQLFRLQWSQSHTEIPVLALILRLRMLLIQIKLRLIFMQINNSMDALVAAIQHVVKKAGKVDDDDDELVKKEKDEANLVRDEVIRDEVIRETVIRETVEEKEVNKYI